MWPGAFGALPTDLQNVLLANSRTGRWGRGELLFHPEDLAQSLHLLLKGAVRLYRIGSGAKEITMDVHAAGTLLGVRALLPDESYGLYAEAMDDIESLVFSRESFQRLLGSEPALAVALTEQLTHQTRGLQERLAGLVFLEVSQRLALALLALGRREGAWPEGGVLALQDRISHQDLAYSVGSTRETITKLLGEFKERGLLDLGYRRIVLTDQEGLERAAKEPLGA